MSKDNCQKHDWDFKVIGKINEGSKLIAECKLCGKEVEYKEGITTQ